MLQNGVCPKVRCTNFHTLTCSRINVRVIEVTKSNLLLDIHTVQSSTPTPPVPQFSVQVLSISKISLTTSNMPDLIRVSTEVEN